MAWADFNSDDSPDFALFGSESTNYLCGIYENDGSGNFTKQDIDLPDLNSVHMAWADYNNDGLPDLAVSGRTAYPELASVCYLFRNDAGINLTNSGIVLPAEQSGLAWGDYDQDGDLDLAFSSGKLYRNDNGTNLTDSLNPPSITSYNIPPIWHDFDADGLLDAASEGYIFHNNGFTYSPGEPDYGVPDAWRIWMQKGDLVYSNWAFPERDVADFNNDGLLDIALSGAIGSSANVRFSVFKQETNQTFTPIGLQQDGFIHGSVTWCDYDGDCDTDLLAGGYDSSINPVLASYNNTLADCGLPNTPPDAPQRFVTTITNDNILLRFHPAYDKETLPARLAYEVRVGTAPGLADIVSPFGLGPFPGNARPIGALSFPENPYYYQKFMNTNALPGIRLRNLSPGRYFWSVRTIDTARAPSPWSTEQAFTLTITGNLDWHHDYYRTLLERQIYPNSPIMLYPKATLTPEWPGSSGLHQETFKATSNDLAGTTFSYSMPGLGAKGFRYQFTAEAYTALSNTSALVLSADNSLQDKDLSVISAVVMADPRGTAPFEIYGTDPNRIRCRVPNLKSHLSIPSDPSKSMRSFIALLTRANASEADTFRTGSLTMTVADQLDGSYSIPDFVHGQFLYNDENAGAPQFTCSTRHTLTDLTGHFYTGTTEVIPGTTDGYSAIVVYQDGRINVPVTFHATPTGPAYTDIYAAGTTNSFTRITLKSQDGYQLSKRLWLGPSLEEQPYVFEPRSFSGSEVLYLDADEQHVYYNIFILFTVYTQQYHNGAPTGTPTPIDTFTSAVSISFMRK